MIALLSILAGLQLGAGVAASAPVNPPPAQAPAATRPVTPAAAPLVAPDQSQSQSQSDEAAQNPTETAPPSLEHRIPPVSSKTFVKSGKLGIAVGMGLSLNDAFVQKFMPELAIGYHISDPFYVGLRGGYAFDASAGHANSCKSDASGTTCSAPTADQLKQLPGNFTAFGEVDFAWTPIYGKVSFFGEAVAHFDTSVVLGAGVLFLAKQEGTDNATTAPEASPGLQERFFLTPAIAIDLAIRDMIYVSGGTQNQLIAHLGFAFLL